MQRDRRRSYFVPLIVLCLLLSLSSYVWAEDEDDVQLSLEDEAAAYDDIPVGLSEENDVLSDDEVEQLSADVEPEVEEPITEETIEEETPEEIREEPPVVAETKDPETVPEAVKETTAPPAITTVIKDKAAAVEALVKKAIDKFSKVDRKKVAAWALGAWGVSVGIGWVTSLGSPKPQPLRPKK